MNPIVSSLNAIVYTGIDSVAGEREKAKTKLVNLFSLVAVTTTFAFIITGIYYNTGQLFFELITIVCLSIPILLNRLQYYETARMALVLGITLALTLSVYIQ